ncbi:MAG TPA: lipid A deacylase LpxR family protein [Longimicrobium sp.]|nr:lipid A deacylase LpxR family protein [Longimicrobium sp.]
MTTRTLSGAALLAILLTASLDAQTLQLLPNVRTDRFYWENDIGFSDRHYTNGLRYSTITSSTDLWARRIGHPVLRLLLLGARACGETTLPGEACHALRTGWAFGQNFYTPDVITTPVPDPTDRPYAGWLYYGWLFELSGGGFVHEAEFDLGIVGPLSLASTVQEGWHDLWGFPHPDGWDHQIGRGLGVQAIYRSTFDLLSGRLDGDSVSAVTPANYSLTPTGRIALGTPITAGQIGAMLRVGRGIPPALVPRIDPAMVPPAALSAALSAEAAAADDDEAAEKMRMREEAAVARLSAERPGDAPVRPAYLFAGASVHGVLHNAFLQGTWLGSSSANPPIDLEMNRTLAELEAGGTLGLPRLPVVGRLDITLRHVWRGAEFSGAPEHRFWAFSAAW